MATEWKQEAGMTGETPTDNVKELADVAQDNADASAVSATESEASATASAASASSSSASASQASTSAANSATSASQSATSATASANSASAANTSANNASTSATNAANSASAASTSETNAAASESTAEGHANDAAVSEANAATSETNAATSETNAATSATQAASSASTAASEASTATSERVAAETAELAASGHEVAAQGYATDALNYRNDASTASSNAQTSASNAATSESNALTSANNSAASATTSVNAKTASEAARDAALAALDSFDDRYLGQKATEPTVDNDGNALVSGALFFNATTSSMMVYDGSAWLAAYASLSGALLSSNNLSDLSDVQAALTNLSLNNVDNTSDLNKPVSTATQSALDDLDQAIANVNAKDPVITLTGDVTGSGTMTNLGNVSINATVGNDSHSHSNYLPTTGGTLDNGTSTSLVVKCDDAGVATLELKGDGQGTGRLYVGQSSTHGGGIEYNGDNVPVSTGAGADYVTLWRRDSGVDYWTAKNLYSDNNWIFRGNLYANTTMRVFADNYHPNADKWTTARTLSLTGDVTGSTSFDGSGNVSITATVADNSHSHDYVPERNRNDWNDSTVISDVIGQMAWKNYGNNHTIFDASAGTSPDGTAINNTNPSVSWSATCPTLMGWNGVSTYGVRVDRAKYAENAEDADTLDGQHASAFASASHTHSYLPLTGGTISGDLTITGTLVESSDARLKENVKPITDALSKVASLQGVHYNKIENPELEEIGFIAQEVEKVVPEIVTTDDTEEGMKAVSYARTVALLVEAMKEQQAQIEDLKIKLEKTTIGA